jgi:hypothetical protein
MILTDHRNDTADFIFQPAYNQSGTYKMMFFVIDESDSTMYTGYVFTITVNNIAVKTILNPIGPLSVLEGASLNIPVTGYDPDSPPGTPNATISCNTAALPAGATFTAVAGSGTGTLAYTATFTQSGVYQVLFRAHKTSAGSNTTLDSTELVNLTVIEAGNQKPKFVKLDTLYTPNIKSDSTVLWIRSSDPDGTTPTVTMTGIPYQPYNAQYVDSANGRGKFRWDPDSSTVDSVFTFRFISTDGALADTMSFKVKPINAICGDANGDRTVNVSDVVYLINYIFGGGAVPAVLRAGDPNCDGTINISDAVYLITYVFASGPPPCANCH